MKKLTLTLSLILITSQSFAAENKKPAEVPPAKPAVVASFADTIEDLMPAVVNISAVQEVQTGNVSVDQVVLGELPKTPMFDDLRKQLENQFRGQKKKISSIGSGFIISKDGFVVTNNHVIDDADEINVSLEDGSKYKAKVIGSDRKTDVALLKITSDKEFKSVKFGDSSKVRIGDWAIVIGNPYGLGGSVTVGVISARGRDINNGQSDEFLQTDAAINKGNSGGPIFNAKGEVIGVSTAIFSPSGGSVGIGFATPAATVAQVVKQLRERGEVTRGWIGVSIQDVPDDIAESMKLDKAKGAFVVDIAKDGPADKAGILPTDIILKFEDQEITEMKLLPKTVSQYPIGKTAKITVWRQGKTKTLKIKVEKMREEAVKTPETKNLEKKQSNLKPSGQVLGLGLADFKSKIKKDKNELNIEGLLVVEVNPKSEAAEKGVVVGDIIVSANQTPVSSVEQLKEIIDEAQKTSKKIFIFSKRGDANYAITLNIGS